MFKFVQSLIDKFFNHDTNQGAIAKQEIQEYIDERRKIYESLINFLEDFDNNKRKFKILTKEISEQKHEEPRENLEQFLQLVINIADNCRRNESLFDKIFKIIEYYESEIKQSMSNLEIYKLFSSNKKLLLFLFQKKIITIDDTISNELFSKIETNGNRYCHFFYPEIKQFSDDERIKSIEKELIEKDPNIFDCFEKKRNEGENEALICTMIRNDLIDDFISYVNSNSVLLNSEIKPSIFETNLFLIENKNITLIEYAAFFGSIQIFKYLVLNNVELKSSLWLYAIHSRNAEIIDCLESNKILPPEITNNANEKSLFNADYLLSFCESIKCHYKEFASFFESNILEEDIDKIKKNKEFISSILQSHNYEYFPSDFEDENEFYYLCCNNYHKLVNLFIKKEETSIKKVISEKINIYEFL